MTVPIKVVGLTGGIATGKSTVGSIMRDAGLPVMDADALGHMVLAPDGMAYEEVLAAFGKEILGTDGRHIDRQKLGRRVFDNPDQRRMLEAITHPAIGELARRGIELIEQRGESMAIYEAALLVETGIYAGMEALIVVTSTLENQLLRVCGRDGLTRQAAAARIASQLPQEEKLAVADYVVENNGSLIELETRVGALVEQLKSRFCHQV